MRRKILGVRGGCGSLGGRLPSRVPPTFAWGTSQLIAAFRKSGDSSSMASPRRETPRWPRAFGRCAAPRCVGFLTGTGFSRRTLQGSCEQTTLFVQSARSGQQPSRDLGRAVVLCPRFYPLSASSDLAMDMFPVALRGSVVGIGGFQVTSVAWYTRTPY